MNVPFSLLDRLEFCYRKLGVGEIEPRAERIFQVVLPESFYPWRPFLGRFTLSLDWSSTLLRISHPDVRRLPMVGKGSGVLTQRILLSVVAMTMSFILGGSFTMDTLSIICPTTLSITVWMLSCGFISDKFTSTCYCFQHNNFEIADMLPGFEAWGHRWCYRICAKRQLFEAQSWSGDYGAGWRNSPLLSSQRVFACWPWTCQN